MKNRIAIDLFSGCGGLSTGLEKAGFDVVAAAEVRSEARATYVSNHAITKIYGDIRDLSASQILDENNLSPGRVDLLAACPPCQGFSSLRTKNKATSVEDERNELLFEVARLCVELKPKCILIENVPALLGDERILKFKKMLAEEYSFSDGVLNAQHFNVPQRRKRMILIASRLGSLGLPTVSRRKLTVRDAIGDLPSPNDTHKRPLHRLHQKLGPLVQRRVSMIKTDRSDLPLEDQLECHKRYTGGFRDVYGRIAWDDVAPTITRFSHNPSKGRFIHPEEDRGLTLYESMLLQGFPRSYKFNIEDGLGKISSMIGEAFPPPLAEAQARHIKAALDLSES